MLCLRSYSLARFGRTSKVMRVIITFRPATQLQQWLEGPVWLPLSADAHTAKKPRR